MNRLKVSGFIYGLLLVGFLPGCKKDFFVNENTIAITSKPTAYKLNLPKSFPPMKIPASNPLTNEGVALGKKLFYDPLLSSNNKQACGSCHQPKLGFGMAEPKH